MYRQGDVLIIPTRHRLARSAKLVARDGRGRIVLAYGEVTGHAHALDDALSELFEEQGGRLYLRVAADAPAALRHEEHAALTLPPGLYEIRHQREYSPEAVRRVSD